MTAEQKLERIKKLIKEANLAEDVSKVNFYSEVIDQSFRDIRDEMWELYCLAYDIKNVINM